MEEVRPLIVLVSVTAYFIACMALGLWAYRKTRSTEDFFMAGRDLGVLVTAFALFSSILSGFGFVGGPGLVYLMGMSSMWMVVCAGIGGVISFALIAKRIRLFAELGNCISLPDVVAIRYQSDSVRASVASVILIGVIGYLATQILAMAIVLQDILRSAGVWTEITLGMAVAISCSVLLFYTVTGGILASVYTDLIQGGVMVVASILVFATVLTTFDGGLGELSQTIMADDPEAIGPWATLGIMGCLSWFFMFGVGAVGQPHVITKSMMMRRIGDIKHIVPLTFLAYIASALLWLGIGLAMLALVVSVAHPALLTPDAAAPQFLQNYTHPLLAGVVFAGLLAAIMSTADGFLNIGTAAIVHDIPTAVLGRPVGNRLWWARIATVAIAVSASLFALYTGDLVALLGAFGWGTFAAALVPVVALGLNWKRASTMAANTAVIASLLINVGSQITGITPPLGVDVGALSLTVSLVLFVGISLAGPQVRIKPDIEIVMDA